MSERAGRQQPHSPSASDDEVSDRRLQRGTRTRRNIARHAVDVASAEGLNGLSIGRLAADLELSKSGVQTLFGTKERLQLVTVEAARQLFTAAVITPAEEEPSGSARLRALIDGWIRYVEEPLFAGGCFWSANLADFDSRPGKVRDALVRQHHDWLALLAAELRQAADAGETADLDEDLAAFQLDAVLTAANTALRLGETDATSKVRRVLDGILAPPR